MDTSIIFLYTGAYAGFALATGCTLKNSDLNDVSYYFIKPLQYYLHSNDIIIAVRSNKP